MECTGWTRGPFGLDAEMGATLPSARRVLVVVHHLTALTRLADVVPWVERDRRIQTLYTVAPASVLSVGASEYLRRWGGVVLPFGQASQLRFDLALAAGHGGLEKIHAPVLTMPHGMGPNVRMHRWAGNGPPAPRPPAGLPVHAIVSGGRVIPSVLAVSHEDHRAQILRYCPEAAPATLVAGDPAFDRMRAGNPRRSSYRRALGVGPDQRLVVVSSTWGRRSLLGRDSDLPSALAAELPRDEYRIVAALHPNSWCWHGRRQILAWYEDCRRLGVGLLPPEEGWRAALIAADHVVGDHGSATYYAAANGVPVTLAAFPDGDVLPGSPSDLLGRIAPRLVPGRPLRGQLDDAARTFTAGDHALLRDRLTSRPGRSAELLRRAMYRLMDLAEPAAPPPVDPLPMPRPIEDESPEEYR